MKTREVHAIIYPENGFFVAQCLDVDISTFGSTKQEAQANLKEALELYFEDHPSNQNAPERPQLVTLTLEHA